jgi:hypothetical protein
MANMKNHLVPMPDGRLMDTRYRFKRGDRVLVIAGPHNGRRATIDSRDGQMKGERGLVSIPTYNVQLGENRWAQVQWDWVQKGNDGYKTNA